MGISAWASVATIGAGFASIASLTLVAWQLRSLAQQTKEAARQTQSSADAVRATIYLGVQERAIDIDRYFAEHPEFRSAFYGPIPTVEGDQAELHRIEAISEMLTDAFELVVSHRDLIPPTITEGWHAYMAHIMANSTQLSDFWCRNWAWYPAIRGFLGEREAPQTTGAPPPNLGSKARAR